MAARAISETAVLVAAGDLLASDFGAEQVILNLKDGVYYGLEEVGARIWRLLQKPTTIPAILGALAEEYDVDSARCERDLRALLGDLVARGLVEVRERA
jgi:Coenzyme PQQ synthesis protein D (PqqD)